jgi:FkbM family methyltransferase
MNLRRIAEILSRRVVLKRHLPVEFGGGPILVSPDSGLRYYRTNLRNADPMLFRMAAELVHRGDVIWDIGANVGLFSFAAAALAGPEGQVFAIEPDARLVNLLHRSANLRVPGRAKVIAIPAAASDSMGLGQLHIAQRGRSSNFMDRGRTGTDAGGSRSEDWVVTVTIDWLLEHLPPPQVLKIDVEGMEPAVLAGATKLLETARPRIWCEVWPGNGERVGKILQAANYNIYDAAANSAERKPLPRAVWDTLALAQA